MQLAIDCRFLGKSGIGTYLENILTELIRNHPENKYLLVCGDVIPDYCSVDNVRILKADIKPFTWKELFFSPVNEINKCDAFFTPYINIPGGVRVPVFCTIHDVIFFDLPYLSSRLGRFIRKWFIGRAIRKSKKVFTVSEFSRSRILHYYGNRKPIEITYNVVSPFIRKAAQQIKDLNKTDDIIFVGNIKKHKGLAVLLKAFEKAKKQGLKGNLLIVGDAKNFKTSDDEVAQLAMSVNDVEFTGRVSNEELCRLITSSKVLVQPSFYEGFGLPPIEAMYLGTQAIVSDIPVFKEIYAGLPVTFFKCGDSDSLSEVLLSYKEDFDKTSAQQAIDEKFNITKEVDHLLYVIKQDKQ